MDNQSLLEILAYWSFWDRPLRPSIPRLVSLPTSLSASISLVVQGVRRAGKSTLLTQLIQHYNLNPAHCIFINFEDPKLIRSLNFELLEQILTITQERLPDQKRYFFLDEIQLVDGWERWLRSKLERPGTDYFIVTGSNASLLSGEFSSALTGRHVSTILYPLSFAECEKLEHIPDLTSYLLQGGFPEPLLRQDGEVLLKQYFNDIVERDIRARVSARSVQPLRQVIQMAYESAGAELSLRRIAGAAGIAVETAAHYLEAAQASYLLFACPFFAYSERKRAAMNKKYYPIDTALRRSVVTQTGKDLGKMLEIAVYIELRRRFSEVYYWREHGEIDFVVSEDGAPTPITVTWDGIQPRHEAAAARFYERFPQGRELVVITKENFSSLGEMFK